MVNPAASGSNCPSAQTAGRRGHFVAVSRTVRGMTQVSLSTLLAVAVCMLALGGLVGYLYGHQVGRREGFEAGKASGKEEGKRDASIRAFAAGYERGKHRAQNAGQDATSSSRRGCLVAPLALLWHRGRKR
jgi:hypothetical protein